MVRENRLDSVDYHVAVGNEKNPSVHGLKEEARACSECRIAVRMDEREPNESKVVISFEKGQRVFHLRRLYMNAFSCCGGQRIDSLVCAFR